MAEARPRPKAPAAAFILHPSSLILIVIILFAVTLRGILMPLPFSRNPEGVGCFYGILGRNFLRYDWSRTHGVPIQTVGYLPNGPIEYYFHHPPLIPLMVAASYAMLGQGDWQTRLPTAIFTIGCIIELYVLLRRWNRPRAGLVAAALFAAMPMTIIYGGQPDVMGTQLVLFGLLSVAAYLYFHDGPSLTRLGLLSAATLAVGITDWPGFLLVPVLGVHYVFTQPPRRWGWIIAFGAVGLTILAGVYIHLTLGAEQPWDWVLSQIHRRTTSTSHAEGARGQFTAIQWLARCWQANRDLHTVPVLVMTVLWLATLSWRRGADRATRFVRLMLAWALAHILIGRQGVYVHDWWWWVVTPGLALAAGLLIDEVIRKTDATPLTHKPTARIAIRAALVAALVALATATTWQTLPFFYDRHNTVGGVDYTVLEMGHAIQLASPDPSAPVIIAYEDWYDLQMWYYGDRPLKLDVWDLWTLENRMSTGDPIDLPFGTRDDWPIPPAGFVCPKQFIPAIPDFVQTMKRRYPMKQTEHFLIFDLRIRYNEPR